MTPPGTAPVAPARAGSLQYLPPKTANNHTKAKLLGAKSAVAGAYGALLVLLGIAGAVVAGVVTAAGSGASFTAGGAAWGRLAGSVAVGTLFAVLATGLGVLTRSTAAAIAAVLLWRFVGEGILPAVLRHDGLSRWTPNGAAGALVGLGAHPLAPAAAGLLLTGYTAAISAVAAALFLRRDPT